MSQFLHQGCLFNLDRATVEVGEGVLYCHELIWQSRGRKCSLDLKDVVGVAASTDSPIGRLYGFVLNAYPQQGQRRQWREYRFGTNTPAEREQWLTKIDQLLNPPRRLLILLNPKSGRKQAKKIWQQVASVFEHGLCRIDLKESSHPLALGTIVRDYPLESIDGLVVIGGDGTIHEVLNGLLQRADGEKALQLTPIGVIPSGTSNGLAKSIAAQAEEAYHPLNAAFLIVKGRISSIDLAIVRQGENRYCSILSLAWGFVSDVDLESDRLRFFGTLKTDIYVLIRLLFLRTYKGKLFLVTAAGETKTIDDEFILLWAMNVPWAAYNLQTAPQANFNDGSIDLLLIRQGVSRWQILWAFLQVGKGKHIKLSYIEYNKVRNFCLEPSENHGTLAIDGEALPLLPIAVDVIQAGGRVFG
jgi:sphingosine kinase